MSKPKKSDYNNEFAKKLRELLEKNKDGSKTTQTELAEKIGITRQAVSQYVDGSVRPNTDTLYQIAKYFNVSADYLIGISTEMTVDEDIKIAAKTSGLSDIAIEQLQSMKIGKDDRLNLRLLSTLIEQGYITRFLDELISHLSVLALNKLFLSEDNPLHSASLEEEAKYQQWKFTQSMSELFDNIQSILLTKEENPQTIENVHELSFKTFAYRNLDEIDTMQEELKKRLNKLELLEKNYSEHLDERSKLNFKEFEALANSKYEESKQS